MKITKISLDHPGYPKLLKSISSPPEQIFVSGRLLPSDCLSIAIVGSRMMSAYGRETAYWFASYLAKKGVTITSGLARGVDSVAHTAALNAGGRTIAVLGSGLDIIYPPENRTLAARIIKNGALVSEFPLGTKPLAKNFLARNRIISGLTLGILVVEGAKRSGSLSIANWAANQGREVFAIPGRIDCPTSYLPNFLIENGANPATKPEDIMEILKSI